MSVGFVFWIHGEGQPLPEEKSLWLPTGRSGCNGEQEGHKEGRKEMRVCAALLPGPRCVAPKGTRARYLFSHHPRSMGSLGLLCG